MITDAEFESLQGIVGTEWVSRAHCMMDTYAMYMNPEIINSDGALWLPRPAAVALPQSVPEIQEIFRLCNKTGLMVKPISTGFHAAAAVSRERVILLDLKRMNRILDIDVKNRIALIEPYVRAIDLQTELFKHGLNVHIVSCGANHSILASHTAAWGYGATGSSTSHSARNLMGVEWVLPSGEIVRLGSSGAGAGWFSPDGPGPSLRGVMRGFHGTLGGLGVFTKAAVKLYPWDGPKKIEFAGKSPVYSLKKFPERIAIHALSFPTAEAMREAGYRLGEAQIDYAQFRTPMFFVAMGLTSNNQELKEALESGIFQKIAGYILLNAVVAPSDGEFKWKMKALKQILRETGGIRMPLNIPFTPSLLRVLRPLVAHVKDPMALLRKFPLLQEIMQRLPVFKQLQLEKKSHTFWFLIRNAVNTQATFRPSQAMSTMLGSFDTWDLGIRQSEYVAGAKQKYMKEGLILDDGGDMGCGGTFENGHMGYLEGIILYNTKNPRSVIAVGDLINRGADDCISQAMGVPIAGSGMVMNAKFGPVCGDYHLWLGRIKKALDPNNVSDPFFYAEPGGSGAGDGPAQTGSGK